MINLILLYTFCLTLALLYKVIKAEMKFHSAKKKYEGQMDE